MVEHELPKLVARVRFPSPAYIERRARVLPPFLKLFRKEAGPRQQQENLEMAGDSLLPLLLK